MYCDNNSDKVRNIWRGLWVLVWVLVLPIQKILSLLAESCLLSAAAAAAAAAQKVKIDTDTDTDKIGSIKIISLR
jgi:hypothetical protein